MKANFQREANVMYVSHIDFTKIIKQTIQTGSVSGNIYFFNKIVIEITSLLQELSSLAFHPVI
jgi:hypothetical protein